ncbi:MAG TPA: hypothetical protein PKC23_01190 [Candidatus Desulfobacillus sp.]|nr:hypothetical protein [Candidatus Desulfobacillus sp.]
MDVKQGTVQLLARIGSPHHSIFSRRKSVHFSLGGPAEKPRDKMPA